jgi:long-chain acyl-CoA synthetase
MVEGYGLSECSPVVCVNPNNGQVREGSIGLPLPGTIVEIREVKGSRKLVKNGNIGELCVIGPQVMPGYWNNEKETRNTLKSGRIHTGDLAYMDADGYVYIVDRIKDLIIVSGFNVYPREIEELLYKHASIEEAAVIGMPDKHRGERIKAFIKLKSGKTLGAKQVQEYLEGKLAKYKLPDEVEFIDDMPKTIIGKIAKKELKERNLHS